MPFLELIPSSIRKYLAYAGIGIAFIFMSLLALHRRDKRMIINANAKAKLKKVKDLHDIRTNQLKDAANRPDDDGLDRMLDDGDF